MVRINPALPEPLLDRLTAQAEARVVGRDLLIRIAIERLLGELEAVEPHEPVAGVPGDLPPVTPES